MRFLTGLWVYVTIDDWLAVALEIYTTAPFEGDTIIAKMESDVDYRKRKGIVKSDTFVSSNNDMISIVDT